MAKVTLPHAENWIDTLAQAIKQAAPGDTIVVWSEAAKELAEMAAARLGKYSLTFEVEARPNPFGTSTPAW